MNRELGKLVATESDSEATSNQVLFQVRCRLFGSAPRLPERRIPLRLWLLVAAAVAAAVIPFALNGFRRPEKTITYTLDGESKQSASFLETNEHAAVIRFDEGSKVTVLPESGMRILDTQPHGVTLSVERGRIDCQVSKHKETDWTVHAGPFDIRVTGTRFAAEWHPQPGRFELTLTEGSVEVSGPAIEGTQRVNAGERLEVGVNDGVKILTTERGAPESATTALDIPTTGRGTPESATTALDLPASMQHAVGSGKAEAIHADRIHPDTTHAPPLGPSVDVAIVGARMEPMSWEALAAAGRYREAAEQIRTRGWDVIARGADVPKARLLADTLRMAGASELARQVLLDMRSRHGSGNETAFLLGKIAADQYRAPSEALRWFERYLQEEPDGALREQALGRCLELEQHAGAPRVRDRANTYLASYPKGGYAALARRILSAEGGTDAP